MHPSQQDEVALDAILSPDSRPLGLLSVELVMFQEALEQEMDVVLETRKVLYGVTNVRAKLAHRPVLFGPVKGRSAYH